MLLDEFPIAIDPVTTMRIEDVLKELPRLQARLAGEGGRVHADGQGGRTFEDRRVVRYTYPPRNRGLRRRG
ncbi:Phosphate transport ATP-binding protein PstB [Candidatus Accumulibacter phosphatis]|uniref:Phosphate transport ATP-binding protein PstB n=1 Tax=Candidatus Accumulibacter phosphatis TaxID=327160 RepID=A0A5S4EHM6_9PROT|nr:Phosphate transport ATP-binding protein PstB [Candidatus Accumulibacter phosphatis]